MELDFPESKLEIIKKQYPSAPVKGKVAMIGEWLNHHPVPSWRKISEALYRRGELHLHTILSRVMITFVRGKMNNKHLLCVTNVAWASPGFYRLQYDKWEGLGECT